MPHATSPAAHDLHALSDLLTHDYHAQVLRLEQ